MDWLQLNLPADKTQIDAWSEALLESGAVSITLDGETEPAVFELQPGHAPIWDKLRICALFPLDADPLQVHMHLAMHINTEVLNQATWQRIKEQDWHSVWKRNFVPIKFGNKLWICPSWAPTPDPMAINVIIDPEQAFGTGTHPTTALCLDWLANNLQSGNRVIDYGCGSGILAIAAAKLGANQVYAVDIDSLALEVTTHNAEKNNISADIISSYLPEQLPNGIKVDVVLANILAKPLIELAPTLASLVKPKGALVLSGILAEQGLAVQSGFARWFTDFEVVQQGEWLRITAKLS